VDLLAALQSFELFVELFSTESSHPPLLSVDIQTLRRAFDSAKPASTTERIAAPGLGAFLSQMSLSLSLWRKEDCLIPPEFRPLFNQ
jgi:hypothetical protein